VPGCNRFAHPEGRIAARLLSKPGNSGAFAAVRRAVMGWLPFVQLQSDVNRVVYLNWVVPLHAVAPLVPEGVELVSREGKTVLTVLTYSHRHFGPTLAGPMRRLFPSPLQSNWRLYVARLHGRTPAKPTVLFIKNVFDSVLYAVATRMFSDALPSHLAGRFVHCGSADGHSTVIESAFGSAPELACDTACTQVRIVPPEFAPFFSTWRAGVESLCVQDSAVCAVPLIDRIAEAGIDLPIPLEEVVPLTSVSFTPGALLRSLGAVSAPFCFYVPKVRFRVLWERLRQARPL
jgi:hypothetical protein